MCSVLSRVVTANSHKVTQSVQGQYNPHHNRVLIHKSYNIQVGVWFH